MRKLVIEGNKPLNGEITISGAKNSTVALIPAAILADSPVILEGIPNIQDVHSLIDILEDFNVEVSFDEDEGIITIDPTNMISIPMPTGKIKACVLRIILWELFFQNSVKVSLDCLEAASWARDRSTSTSKDSRRWARQRAMKWAPST